jgi:isopropylmalate/homocitrate/citramalate synthase
VDFAPEVYIVDSTIRSLQSGVSGSLHTAQDLVDIGVALDDLGVRELIVNLSWKDGLAACEGLAKTGLKRAKIVGTFRARHDKAQEWARDGVSAGCDEICFESAHDGEHFKRLADSVRSSNRSVSHGFAEAYAYEEVVEICRAGVAMGAQSQSFHDSYFRFALTPEGAKSFYRSVRCDVPNCPPLYVHLSNFYGNATMTAVAALAAGANAADVCMNGIGHHCGHIQMAEIVAVLEALYRVPTGIKVEKLAEVSALVRERTGVPMPLPSPVVGDYAFMIDGAYWAAECHIPYEERIHAKFPIAPGSVGNREQVIWAPGTINAGSVRAKMAAMGFTDAQMSDAVVEQVIWELESTLRQRALYPNWVSDREFEQLCRDCARHVRH